ncbi:putative zinc-regulated transporter 2 [Thelephora terrestris]|uniref:Zinc-regulated transporter 2 n=1 Tax=Thelephora terrestris TaxID=56493 RepID=A0A9P6HLT3_9AGAM|nr:putative zinc-regulated transporter 2 [Thelephora terrestris]
MHRLRSPSSVSFRVLQFSGSLSSSQVKFSASLYLRASLSRSSVPVVVQNSTLNRVSDYPECSASSARLARLGIPQECDTTCGHHHVHHEKGDEEAASTSSSGPDSALAQIISIAILEFSVALHSVLVGLTLAVNENFIILFVVLIFHHQLASSVFFHLRYSLNLAETFEGLGIGSRLAFLEVDKKSNWVPIAAAFLYGLTTPIGIAAGLGARSIYNPGTVTALIVSGTMDSISAGILIYTSLLELMAHDFLFNKEMLAAPQWKINLCSGFDDARCSVDGLTR